MVEIIGPVESWLLLLALLSIIAFLVWYSVHQSRRLQSQASRRDKMIGELQDRLKNEQQKTRLLQFLLLPRNQISFEVDETEEEDSIELEIPQQYVGHA